jgi:hypothetical protein
MQMYPKTFLDNFWRGDLRREVFVIMPFHESLTPVWEKAIRPAIEELKDEDGSGFRPHCVRENTPSGDVIREIIDGITNSTLVFADISLLPGEPLTAHRNGNVMYELGIANAFREEVDIIVVKSDRKSAEFDIAPNRYHEYSFDDLAAAKNRFLELLRSGLRTREGVKKSIAESTWASLDIDCFNFMLRRPTERPFLHPGHPDSSSSVLPAIERTRAISQYEKDVAALRRLLSLGLVSVEYVAQNAATHLTWYQFTPFGKAVRNNGKLANPEDIRRFGPIVFGRSFTTPEAGA